MQTHEILDKKGREVHTIAPEADVDHALATLVERHIGALMVLDDAGRVLGIITERDVLRLAASNPGGFRTLRVRDVMTRDLVTARGEDSISHVLALMTNHRIRHMPILEGDALVGLVSIGDLVKGQLDEVREENGQLRDYLYGI